MDNYKLIVDCHSSWTLGHHSPSTNHGSPRGGLPAPRGPWSSSQISDQRGSMSLKVEATCWLIIVIAQSIQLLFSNQLLCAVPCQKLPCDGWPWKLRIPRLAVYDCNSPTLQVEGFSRVDLPMMVKSFPVCFQSGCGSCQPLATNPYGPLSTSPSQPLWTVNRCKPSLTINGNNNNKNYHQSSTWSPHLNGPSLPIGYLFWKLPCAVNMLVLTFHDLLQIILTNHVYMIYRIRYAATAAHVSLWGSERSWDVSSFYLLETPPEKNLVIKRELLLKEARRFCHAHGTQLSEPVPEEIARLSCDGGDRSK